jgi:hypothetical protein
MTLVISPPEAGFPATQLSVAKFKSRRNSERLTELLDARSTLNRKHCIKRFSGNVDRTCLNCDSLMLGMN